MQKDYMEANENRLVDEAVSHEVIKNTFRLTWEFIVLNRKFTVTAMLGYVILNILGMIPVLVVICMVLVGILGTSLQMYMGQLFHKTENIETFVFEVKEMTFQKVLDNHLQPAFGAYLGLMLLLILIVTVFMIIAQGMGISIAPLNNASDMLALMLVVGLPVLLIGLLFSFVQPLVRSNIILARTFKEGFFAVWTFFSAELWRKAMNVEYFKYVSISGLIIFVAALLLILIVPSLLSIPLLGTLLNLVLFAGMYVFLVFGAVLSMMARKIVHL